MSKKERRETVFSSTIELLQLEVHKFETMLKLIESLAWQQLKQDVAPKSPTVEQRENLLDNAPITFTPNYADFTWKERHKRDRVVFKQLKNHMAAIKKILENAIVIND